MDPITIGIGIVILVTAAVSAAVRHYNNKVKRANEALDKLAKVLGQYADAYLFEDCDKVVINEVKQYTKRLRAKGKLSEIMQSMNLKDRKDYISKVVCEIAFIMKVELSDINIIDLGPYTFGQSYVDDGKYKIDLNEVVLIADPDRLLQTVCHELRHLQQMQSLSDDKWGFSNNRKAQWILAFNNYVQADSDSEIQYTAYVMQSIEIDANKFANEVTGEG